jgi:guanosine-3',5'-bis(diphosphate) 3'-pyrophosphohydrolase
MTEMTSPASGILKAAHFAADKHRDQRRKGIERSPYINHPIAVAEILTNIGEITDLKTIQAALLHDTIEDTDTTADELAEHFGAEVMHLVAEVTDNKSLDKAVRKQLQIEHAPHLSTGAKLIKLADKISNVTDIAHRPPQDWDDTRRLAYFEWSEKVVAGCRDASHKLASHFDELLKNARATVPASAGD